MKKVVILSISLLTLISCKKHYTCFCEEYVNGVASNLNYKSVGFEEKDAADAEWLCKQLETEHTINGGTIGFQCSVTQD